MKDSSFIKEVVWNNGNLFVRLKSGKFYEYENVPQAIYEDFVAADSLGKFFGENIKDQYDFAAYEEPTAKTVKGGRASLPKPYTVPVTNVVTEASAWPFPTSKKP